MIEIKFMSTDSVLASIDAETLEGVNLDGLYLHRAHLVGANLKHTSFCNANLDGAELGGADLSYSDLSGANLSNAKLDGANLSHTKLVSADLTGALLDGACLDHADLNNANVFVATINNTSLRSANMNVANADWIRNHTRGAIFNKNGNLLKNSIFYLCKTGNDPSPLLEGVVYDEFTKWPKGFEPEKNGAVFCKSGQPHINEYRVKFISNLMIRFNRLSELLKQIILGKKR